MTSAETIIKINKWIHFHNAAICEDCNKQCKGLDIAAEIFQTILKENEAGE